MKITKTLKKNILVLIDALRSGEYQQTTSQLQGTNGFCCLGVACVLFIPEKNRVMEHKLYQRTVDKFLSGNLPEDQEYAPNWLKKLNEDFRNKTSTKSDILSILENIHSLSYLNDEMGLSFDEIADCLQAVYIEEVLK